MWMAWSNGSGKFVLVCAKAEKASATDAATSVRFKVIFIFFINLVGTPVAHVHAAPLQLVTILHPIKLFNLQIVRREWSWAVFEAIAPELVRRFVCTMLRNNETDEP